MIVISAGMEKSGSALYFNMINDLLIASGKDDVRKVKTKYHLEWMLELKNCNVREPTARKLLHLLKLHIFGKSFVVKTHFPPTPLLSLFVTFRIMKPLYIYRDPRDVILSAIDHGRIHHLKDQLGEYFSRFVDVRNSISIVKDYLVIWDRWKSFKSVLLVKYEDLISNPKVELNRAAEFLNLRISDHKLEEIVLRYFSENRRNLSLPIHFNQGRSKRYRELMSNEEIALCEKHLGNYIRRMGYSLQSGKR